MRRCVMNMLSSPRPLFLSSTAQIKAIHPPSSSVKCLHTTPLLFKRRSDSKARHREEKQAKKQELEAQLESAEEWLDTHDRNHPETIHGKRSMLLEETDPFEMDAFSQKLKDALDRLRKDGSSIKQGRSDPELIRGLYVELPADLGGKMPFLDVATVGPKPGDARSLLITVFDTEYTKHIVRAIAQSYPTLNPQPAPKNDMQLIIPLPPMTKEKRIENQKKAKELGEKQKTVIRNVRQEHLKLIKNALKEDPGIGKDAATRVEKNVEKQVKSTLEEVDRITEQIKKDVMVA